LPAAARKILSIVYLNILKHKGLIEVVGNRITLRNFEECRRQTERKYKDYRNTVDTLLPIWKDYAHIYVLKLRSPRLILLKDLDASITDFQDSMQHNPEREVQLQIILLLDSLIDHFEENIRPKIEGAVRRSRELVESVKAKFDEFEQKCQDAITGYNISRRSNFVLSDIKEYSALKKRKNDIIDFYSTELNEEELSRMAESLDKELFDFHDYHRDDRLFNIKVYTIENMTKSFIDDVNGKLKQIDLINTILANIKSKKEDLESKIVTFKLGEGCIITSKLFSSLQQLFALKKESVEMIQEEFAIKFSEIEKDLKKIESSLNDKGSSLGSVLGELREIHSVEVDYVSKSNEVKTHLDTFAVNLDVKDYLDVIHNLRQSLDESQKEYSDLYKSLDWHEIEAHSLRKVRKRLESILDRIDEIQRKMEDVWKTYEDAFKEKIDSTFSIFVILSERGQRVDEEELKGLTDRANNLLDLVKKIRPWLGEVKIGEIENELLNIISEASELLQRYLSTDEALVLRCIIDERKKHSKDWVTMEELAKIIKPMKEEINVEEIVRRLIEKRILTQGVSFYPG
jgi:hypothetical protein